jgi:FkbM family methyltransferase
MTGRTDAPLDHGPAVLPFGHFSVSSYQSIIARLGSGLPQNWLGGRCAAWLRSLVRRTVGPVDVERLGSRMRLNLADNASERRLFVTPEWFDSRDLATLRSHITPDFCFIDMGANVGTYSLFVARCVGPGARILAIEPIPQMAKRLSDNIRLNGYAVTVAQVAVSDDETECTLHIDTKNFGSTSLSPQANVRGRTESVRVPALPLLELVLRHGFERIDALKADIEGFEDRAILSFIRQAPPKLWPRLIIVEDNSGQWREDLLAELQQRGWRPIGTGTTNLLLIRDATEECRA